DTRFGLLEPSLRRPVVARRNLPPEEKSMKIILATSLLSLALVSGPALAQTAQPADRNAPAATTAQTPANKMMLKGNWRASKLIGLDVYNEANEKLGDVNELILDKTGK